MLTVERSVPLLEGLKLAVEDDGDLPTLAPSDLDHHHRMSIAGLGFAITACLVLVGCGVGIMRRRFGSRNSAQPL